MRCDPDSHLVGWARAFASLPFPKDDCDFHIFYPISVLNLIKFIRGKKFVNYNFFLFFKLYLLKKMANQIESRPEVYCDILILCEVITTEWQVIYQTPGRTIFFSK